LPEVGFIDSEFAVVKVDNEPAVKVDELVISVPLAVFSVRLPEPPEERVPAPAKSKAVADTEIVSIDVTPVSAPAVVTFRPLDVSWNVPVAFPIAVFALPLVFMDAVPPAIVSPALPVKRPADVMVPVEVVEIFPDVVMVSPAVTGDKILEDLCQY
jgi:hypothetical protein